MIFRKTIFSSISGYIKYRLSRYYSNNLQNAFVLTKDAMSHVLISNNTHEPEVIFYIKFFSKKKSDFLIDIGANTGLVSSQLTNNFKEIHLFEPNEICMNICKSNLLINAGKSNNYFYEYGISNKEMSTNLTIPKNNYGGAFIKNNNLYSEKVLVGKDGNKSINNNLYTEKKIMLKNGNIEFNKLFKSLKKRGLKDGVVKIDVEGYELIVLEAILSSLKMDNLIIFFELWDFSKELEILLKKNSIDKIKFIKKKKGINVKWIIEDKTLKDIKTNFQSGTYIINAEK